jgi:P pilus assembly chaperone PapD
MHFRNVQTVVIQDDRVRIELKIILRFRLAALKKNTLIMKTSSSGARSLRALSVMMVAVVLSSLSVPGIVLAQKPGALIVNPKRIVFEGGSRNDMLTLINTGPDSSTYQVTPAQMQMDEDGNLTEVDSIANEATPLIRYFPKQVTLGPGQSQTVRIQLLKPSSLAPGEYRSFLKFIPTKRAKAITERPDTSKKLHFSVATVFSVAVPVIVRHNTTPSIASIGGLKIGWDSTMKTPNVEGSLYRSGNQSLYGMFVAKLVLPNGDEKMLCTAKGIGVYTPNLLRRFRLPLDVPKGSKLSQGKLVVEFQTYSPEATKESVLASAQLALH